MKKRILVILMVAVLTVAMIPTCSAYYTASDTAPTVSKPWYGVVNEACNIRQSPSTSSTIVSSAESGSYIHIVGKNGNWYEVQFENSGTTGYIRSDLLNVSSGTHYYVVANTNVQFRSAPSTSGTALATIFSGESFPRRYNSGNWVCGVYAKNMGYSHGDYVTGELSTD